MGLEIFFEGGGGGGHEFAHLVWVFMHVVTNEKKIFRILVKQNMNRKIARFLSKNYPTN